MDQKNIVPLQNTPGKKPRILFASFPGDGHFNPLTGIAVYLQNKGYDVRFYAALAYREKVNKLGIPFYPFVNAREMDTDKIDDLFPDRRHHKSQLAKLNHDIINVFIKQGPEYYADLLEIRKTFSFDLMVADVLFTGIPFVTDLMKIPVAGVGVVPITKNSKDLPPSGIGMLPSYSLLGRVKQNLLRSIAKNILFAKANKAMIEIFGRHDVQVAADNVFDLLPVKCSIVLQTGTPGFEYSRSDLDPKYKFVGPLLPFRSPSSTAKWYSSKLMRYKKVVLVTQGTVERDETKLLVPALTALRNTDFLVVVTTGGSKTKELREQYSAPNVIIEDYIPFDDIMPYASVYVTNGGMGGVQLSIEHKLPMVTAGVHEGKNEICARVGYFGLGINLKTERPGPKQIRKAIEEVTANGEYRRNVTTLSNEFSRYNPFTLSEYYIKQLLPKQVNKEMESEETDSLRLRSVGTT